MYTEPAENEKNQISTLHVWGYPAVEAEEDARDLSGAAEVPTPADTGSYSMGQRTRAVVRS